jgi:hypothetical protein
MKKTLIALAMLSHFAHADEGMWMPQQLPQVAKQLKAAGLTLDPAALTKLTEFPMGAIVSLGGCSASFVSKQGLVATNHHCVYDSVAHNSTPERDLLANGFLARTLADELPAAPGSRIFVTIAVSDVSAKIIQPDVAKLTGKLRSDAIEKNQKNLIAACEKDAGHRCTVPAFYGGLAFYLIKQLEIRDVRLVHAPAVGIGKFGGDIDNWMWPRHTGDYGFYRAYVSPDGKAAGLPGPHQPPPPAVRSDSRLRLALPGVRQGVRRKGRDHRARNPRQSRHHAEICKPGGRHQQLLQEPPGHDRFLCRQRFPGAQDA